MKLTRRQKTVCLTIGLVAGMTGFSFAAVPLYRIFCQVTGLNGTTQRADQAPDVVSAREVTVTFNADTAADMPWKFYPKQQSIRLKVGESALVYYRAENPTNETIAGQASFNVTPDKVGRYFNKIQCFCFNKQVLGPGEAADMAVTFFLDPAMLDDKYLNDVTTLTLSYSFFRLPSEDAPPRAASLPVEPADRTTKIQ